MKKLTTFLAIAGLACLAPIAAAQNADQNTAGPTKNTLQLRVSEPAEGAQITGSTIRVAVDYNKTGFGEGQGTHFGDKNFPHPIFDVFVDNSLKASLKGTDNVAVIENVPPGKHKIVVMAKNISNEVIDRKEINVTNIEAAASSATTMAEPAAAPPAPAAPAPVYAAPSTTETTTMATPVQTTTASDSTLPATGSNAPNAAVLGLTLLAGGLYVARRSR